MNPNFDIDTELNESEATSNSGPRTDSEHGSASQMSATGALSSVLSLSALTYKTTATLKVFLVQPSSIAAERVFQY